MAKASIKPALAAAMLAFLPAQAASAQDAERMSSKTTPAEAPARTDRFARLALDCVHREYPNKISHVLNSDQDALPPHELTPTFYGCFDWHSSVHGHWLLTRILTTAPDTALEEEIRTALAQSFTEGYGIWNFLNSPNLSGVR